MQHPRTEAAHLAASLEAALRRRMGRGVRRAQAPSTASTAESAPTQETAPDTTARAASPRTQAGQLRPTAPTGAGTKMQAPTPPPKEPAGAEELRQLAASAPDLDALAALVAKCEACDLCKTRSQTVFADGSGSSGILFVGEAPGADEDAQGLPFVGKAGQFLTRIIQKGMGIERSEVYIANILKCRPPENRDPHADEKALCTAWLDRQIELLDPRVIVPLGRHAAAHLTGKDLPMGRLRGQVHRVGGRSIVPTYHPSYLIRQEGTPGFVRTKKLVWEDIQLAMREANLDPKA